MLILELGGKLPEVETEEWIKEQKPAVFVADSQEAREAMELAKISYEGDLSLWDVEFCKIETQKDCLAGTLYIPKLKDVQGERYRMIFFINEKHVVIIDDDDFARRLIGRIQQKRAQQSQTREHFLYSFLTQFMSRDIEVLGRYERRIMGLEAKLSGDEADNLHEEMIPLRRDLLTLRGYYDEMQDVGRELEEDENEFFDEEYLKYFNTVADRADRLMGRTAHLLEYAQQVQDAYQVQVDAEQNRNMGFLTVMSSIFYPLTLITGWYGMNFQNMPELVNGYPAVIILSLIVVVVIVFVFKKKKLL